MTTAELYAVYCAHPSVRTDTRALRPGDLFFALKGPSFNGNAFAKAALDAGAAYAVIDEPAYIADDRYLLVPDVLRALQDLARHHRRQFRIPFLAITGSNGKTTTKELITAVLRQRFVTYATAGNLNNHIGVPLTLLSIGRDAEMAVIEMGANHLGEIAAYCAVAEPTHGLITNLGKAHIEGFGSEEGVRRGKGELYDFLQATGGAIFRYADVPFLKEMAAGISQQITYGAGDDATYSAQPAMNGIFLSVKMAEPVAVLETQLVGAYNFPNVMSAVAAGRSFGVSMDDIAGAFRDYSPDNSRSQWLQRGGNQIVLDAYNANPSSMRAAIENFAAAALPGKRLWIGAMKEMGATERAEHAALVVLIDQFEWDEVMLVGREFEAVKGRHQWFADSTAAAAQVRLEPPTGASILIKGSRGSRMEALLDALNA